VELVDSGDGEKCVQMLSGLAMLALRCQPRRALQVDDRSIPRDARVEALVDEIAGEAELSLVELERPVEIADEELGSGEGDRCHLRLAR